MTTAIAHPNVALIKYWGKSNVKENIPSTPSLSLTLSELKTHTVLSDSDSDELWLNNAKAQDQKVFSFLNQMRDEFGIGTIKIKSENNFPTGAGLASSASGFAALTTAINSHFSLGLLPNQLSALARKGSASAARSVFGGIVSLKGPLWSAEVVEGKETWPLSVVVAKTSDQRKNTSSTQGMEITRKTSPYYSSWLEGAKNDFEEAVSAIKSQDFEKLADVSEKNCLKMIGIMLSSIPPLIYWNSATIECIHLIQELRGSGEPVFFTNDAGPQIKAVCLKSNKKTIASKLSDVVGKDNIFCCEIGDDARTL